ncbi:MAG: N-acetyltransferase family protein [Acidimicrobiales bacterium]
MQVRVATLEDGEAIRAIYNHEVTNALTTLDLRPRSRAEQLAWMSARTGAHVVLVATAPAPCGEVVGFASLSPYRDRPGYSPTVEDSIYVRGDQQGKGVGRVLLGELISVARTSGFHSMMARIVGPGDASVALHRALGFEPVGVEREVGRKFGRWLDVLLMQRLL